MLILTEASRLAHSIRVAQGRKFSSLPSATGTDQRPLDEYFSRSGRLDEVISPSRAATEVYQTLAAAPAPMAEKRPA
jgi:hypothetical protein